MLKVHYLKRHWIENTISTLPSLIILADLDYLTADSLQTFLAPTNRAFDTLARSYGENLLYALTLPENQAVLEQLIQAHLIDGVYTIADLFESNGDSVSTLAGNSLRIGFEGRDMLIYDVSLSDIFLNDAKIVIYNLQASNGFVQGIDKVLLTPTHIEALNTLDSANAPELPSIQNGIPLAERGNLLQTAQSQTDLSIMIQILEGAELGEILTETRHTVLIPTNEAIQNFANEYGTALLAPENSELLREILNYHLLEGNWRNVQFFRAEEPIPTLLENETLTVEYVRGNEIRRLAQVGAPDGANYAFIDPDNPDNGVQIISTFFEAPDVLNIQLEPVTEISFSLDNYTEGLEAFDFWTYFKNSTIVTIAATIVTLIINSMAAFALSKYKFKGRDLIFVVIISTLMVPVSVILIPAFLVIFRNWME